MKSLLKRIMTLLLSVALASSIVLVARTQPDDPPPYTGGRSGGSRGCSTDSANSDSSLPALILLDPTQGKLQTVSTQPKFAWFVRDSRPWPLEFRLYKYDSVSDELELIAEVDDLKSSPGIMVLSLSDSTHSLSVGEQYLWQVELICDPNRPSGNPYAEIEMEVIEVSADLNMALEEVQEELKQAILYQKKNLFYDALSLVLIAEPTPELSELKRLLLEQVALDEAELTQLQSSSVHQVHR